MRSMATNLLTEFGNTGYLQKPSGQLVYDSATRKNTRTYTEYSCKCVMKAYSAEMIGTSPVENIIKMGDVSFVITMDDISIIPTEGVDKLSYGGNVYNILNVETIDPSGALVVVYKLHCRRTV